MGAQFSRTPKSMFPLKFKVHNFDVFAYNTLKCRVIYNRSNFSPFDAEDLPTGPPPNADYRDSWRRASYLGIRNFPPPAQVTWTSLDGAELEAKIDMKEIFKGERVLYKLPDEEIPEGSFNGSPDVFLEVNDRTISVFMQAFLISKTEQIPGNKHSDYRSDLMLAWCCNSALNLAPIGGHATIVMLLLREGLNIDADPFLAACTSLHEPILTLMLEGIDVKVHGRALSAASIERRKAQEEVDISACKAFIGLLREKKNGGSR